MAKKKTRAVTKKKVPKKPVAKTPSATRRKAGSRRSRRLDQPEADPSPIPVHDGEPLSFTLAAPGIDTAQIVGWDIVPGDGIDVGGPTWLWYHDTNTPDTDRIHLYTLRNFKVTETSAARRKGVLVSGKLTITIKSTFVAEDGRAALDPVTYTYEIELQT